MSRSPYRHAVMLPRTKFRWNRTITWWVMAKKAIFKMAAAAILNFKNFSLFCHMTVIGFNIWCSVPSLIKIGRFVTEIWRFNDFQNGGRPPSWILKICSFCYVGLVDMPFSFLLQNFAEIGQSVNELWPKNRFSRWRPPPSWISKIFVFFCRVTVIGFNIWYKMFSVRKNNITVWSLNRREKKKMFRQHINWVMSINQQQWLQ